MSYISNNFLLTNKTSIDIYSSINELPICDYHCHLNEKEILDDKPFNDIYELTLKYDHYKWRLMRFAGVDESYITGEKSNKEKFIKYCEVLSTAFGNPLYHWSQMEIKKYFGCSLEINKENAEEIWNQCNKAIKEKKISPVKLINQSNVKYICTTNKMFDDLSVFSKINCKELGFEVYPTYRPDDFLNINCSDFTSLLEKAKVSSFDEMLNFLEEKLEQFVKVGCKVADISTSSIHKVSSKEEAKRVFDKKLRNEEINNEDIATYNGYMMYFFMSIISKRNLVVELHLGATRNNNIKMFNKLGCDCGCDSIGEENTIEGLKDLLNKLNNDNALGKVIIFNLNQKDNKQLITLIGSFNSSTSRVQYGPAWWFLDNLEGITQQLKDLSSLGHLGSFIGMLTDSRSFLSYIRHDYFRRILANYLGEMVENGLISNDTNKVKEVARNISFYNSVNYFKF